MHGQLKKSENSWKNSSPSFDNGHITTNRHSDLYSDIFPGHARGVRMDFGISRGDFPLTYFEDGILLSAFMVGLLMSSPIFAKPSHLLCCRHNPFRLIGVGLFV